jgi:anti-sigma B factor antagonist
MHWTEISTREVGDVVVVDLRGRVTIADESAHATDAIRELLRQGRTKILVNLVHVPYIDSLGVGDIVRGFIATERSGGILKLCGVAGRVRAVLVAIQLSGVIESFESEHDALVSFHAQPGSP